MQTFVMFLLIIASVVLMVFAISKLKMHPFIVMLVIAMLLGLCWGIYQPAPPASRPLPTWWAPSRTASAAS